MKQHYLPQFYLKGFCVPESPIGYEPYLWVYFRSSQKWQKRAPKNLATESDLYSFIEANGNRNDEIEKMLSVIESRMAEIIKTKIEKRQPLNFEDRVTIAIFVAFMSIRVPAFHEHIGSFVTEVAERIMMLQANHPEAFPALKKHYEQETGQSLPEWFGPKDLDPSKYIIQPSKTFLLGLVLSPVNEIAYIFSNMNWTFFFTSPEVSFITSDWPYCIVNPKLVGSFYGPGLAQRDVEVTVPLTSTVTLFARWEKGDSLYKDARINTVEQVNRKILSYAQKFIIANRIDFPGCELVAKWAQLKKSSS